MRAVRGRDKNAFFRDTQQLAQHSDLSFETHASLQQLVAGHPVECRILEGKLDGLLHGLAVAGVER